MCGVVSATCFEIIASTMAAPDRKLLLQRSWTEVARGYQTLFVPRFMPWTIETLDAFLEARPPQGLVAVPCCGPGLGHDSVLER